MKKLIDTYPEIAAEWHPTKNENLNLNEVSYGSGKKVWWICKNSHEYPSRIAHRTNGQSCPICRKGLPISITHLNLVNEWHSKNIIKPDEISAGSTKKIWWLGQCGHEWLSHLHNRAKGNGCPYCSNKLVNKTNSLLTQCPEIAAEWHPAKNIVTANEVNYRTWKKYWWLGQCGHEWLASVRCRTKRLNGCPICQDSKGEAQVEKALKKLNVLYTRQKRFDTCKDKRTLPFDFHLQDLNILIEYHGRQHYESINFGGDYKNMFELVKKHDKMKEDWCINNNVQLIVIPYTDFKNIENIVRKEVFNS
jgi:Probable Zinc-ribbon domain